MAAGFFFVSGQFLIDVPFDPYLPWIFMGEEILLSSRAYTSGSVVPKPKPG
jgi:[Skp1-protein]-hydroxyproline N-acetylglucosaminyltransferase